MVEMSYIDIQRAYEVYRSLLGELPMFTREQACVTFSAFTQYAGSTAFGFHPNRDAFMISDEAKIKMDALLGPHSRAIFRAWVYQQCPEAGMEE